MPRLTKSVPKYRKHRASGQAIVTLNGRDHYLGPHRTQASRIEYDRLIGRVARKWTQPVAGFRGDNIGNCRCVLAIRK